jgi:hypothetical protein
MNFDLPWDQRLRRLYRLLEVTSIVKQEQISWNFAYRILANLFELASLSP